MADFNQAVEFVLKHEGEFIDNPNDPGGATNFGITQRTLDQYHSLVKDSMFPILVKNLIKVQAVEIYQLLYWQPSMLADVADTYQPFVNKLFDMCVNMGQETALALFQLATTVYHKTFPEMFQFLEQYTHYFETPENGKLLMCKIEMTAINHRFLLIGRNPWLVDFWRGWVARDIDR